MLMKTPRDIYIDITARCNLHCAYCYHFGSLGEVARDLGTAEWLAFFRHLKECSVLNVTLSGGEPFVRGDIRDILESITQNNMRFSILSNATLITEDMARFLSETSRCDQVQVSIDGPNSEIHETARSKGSFRAAVRGIRYLQKYNVPVAVRTTIHKRNLAYLAQTIRFILDDLSIPTLSTNATMPAGLCGQDGGWCMLDMYDRSRAMETFKEILPSYKGRLTGTAGPLVEFSMWSETPHDVSSGGYLSGCGCIFSQLSVRADRIMVPRNFLNHIELGKINEDKIDDIWQAHPDLVRLRERRMIPLATFDSCRDCFYIKSCTGNCPGNSFLFTKDVYVPDTHTCFRAFLDGGGKLPAKQEKLS